MTTSNLASMAPQVSARLQDPLNVFWSLNFELYPALSEAVSELLLIIGRPTAIFNQLITIQPNTVWQAMPSGLLAITNIRSNISQLGKTTLHSLDYVCGSWSSSWESDRAYMPARWAPLGLAQFIVHPAVVQPVQVTVTGIAYPFTDSWPPTGQETSPFHVEIDQALEMYATAYCRLKEIGNDAFEGFKLYQSFLEIGQRLSQVEDRRDSLVWTRSMGAPTAPSQVSHR